MGKSKKHGIKIPGDTDFGILIPMYDFRLLATHHVQYFVPITEDYAKRKLQLLKASKLITSIPISGGYQNKKRQGSAYAITGKGISLLRKYGYDVQKSRDELRVTKEQMPFLLTGYDAAFELQKHGWSFEEQRKLKNNLNLDRQSVVKGKLTSPVGVEWIFFVTLGSTCNMTLAKFKKDMESIKRYPNKAIIVTGARALKETIDYFMKEESIVRESLRCNIIPKPYIHSYFRYLSTDEEFFSFLQQANHRVKYVKTGHEMEQWQTDDGYAVVNLLDMDLAKVYEMYSSQGITQGRIKGFKVITSPQLHGIHEELLGHLPYVHFEQMDMGTFAEHFETIQNN